MDNMGCSIAGSMERDHRKIDLLLDSMQEGMDTEVFSRFRMIMEKHMLIEEDAIFSVLRRSTKEYGIVEKLLEEHDTILKMMISAGRILAKGGRFSIEGLKELIARHKSYEDEMFYPMLDRELADDEKERICMKLKQV